MGLLTLESCCCVCTLKTGTKIIGWIGLVINILLFIQAVSTILFIRSHAGEVEPDIHKAVTSEVEPDIHKAVTTIKYIMWVVALTSLISAICSVLLLLGVYQDRENFVLIFAIVCAICVLINVVQILVLLISAKDKMLALRQTVVAVFQIYFFLVVNSYYHSMDGAARNYS